MKKQEIKLVDGKQVKLCTKCKILKSFSEFRKDTAMTLGISSQCIDCKNNATKLWRENNPLADRKYHVAKNYKMSLEEFDILREKQGYRCDICQKHESETVEKILCVDHCHTTGKVRGLLCGQCNKMLGLFNDDIECIKKAIEYLKENE